MDYSPPAGTAAVQVGYDWAPSATTVGRAAVNNPLFKATPYLAAAGTTLEYGLYWQAGPAMQDQAGKATVRDFTADVTLDVGKGVVAGAAGAWAAGYTGAAIGSFIPVPVLGTALGFGVGLTVGYLSSVGVEKLYDNAGARNFWKGR